MALAVILVAASMLPGDMKKASNANGESAKPRTFVNFVYLAAFCTHVGAQFWMTFISGEWTVEQVAGPQDGPRVTKMLLDEKNYDRRRWI